MCVRDVKYSVHGGKIAEGNKLSDPEFAYAALSRLGHPLTVMGTSTRCICERYDWRALPRVRTLYRECVGLVVTLALVADALTLGPKVGLIVANRMPNAWVVATFAGVFLASVVLTVRVLISFCQNLERPIGSDPTDLPVLSYVMAAAEISLRQIRQQSDKMRDAYRLFTGAREFHGAPQPAAAHGSPSVALWQDDLDLLDDVVILILDDDLHLSDDVRVSVGGHTFGVTDHAAAEFTSDDGCNVIKGQGPGLVNVLR